MSKELIIAEKPSVAKAIARCLGVEDKVYSSDGLCYCFSDDKYYVAYASGHLYDLGMPEDYGYEKKWSISELPICPDFKIFEKKGKINSRYAETMCSLRAFISYLMNSDDVTTIVCATDAAREGQLIFDHIYSYNKCSKPCKRLWANSLTDEALKKSFSEMKDISEYEFLLQSAKTRERLDWLFGINLSRLYSVLDETTHKIGRVKTPLLSVIVERDTEILNFKPKKYYQLYLSNGAESKRFFEKEEVDKILTESENQDIIVTTADETAEFENRPKLYNLLTAQMDGNEIYGYTAEETLNIIQSLYEKRLVTYPRTDSEYLPTDMIKTCLETVMKMERTERVEQLLNKGLNTDSRIINDSKVSDHHAIIPTDNPSMTNSLTEDERNIYSMIVNRFLNALDEKFSYKAISYKFMCAGVEYSLKNKIPIEFGWKQYDIDFKNDKEISELKYNVGDTFTDNAILIKEGFTQSKKHFTDKTLLMVMDNINNRIDNEELKKSIEKKGIGTPATRARIIEELIEIGYAERKGKQIIATDFGIEFSNSLPDSLKSLERTAEWEKVFDDMQAKHISSDNLEKAVIKLINDTISHECSEGAARISVKNPNAVRRCIPIMKCPNAECNCDIVDKGDFWGCTSYVNKDEKGCGFFFKKTAPFIKGEITEDEFKKMIAGEEVTLTAISQSRTYNKNKFKIEKTDGYYNLIFGEREVLGSCPLCGKGIILRGKSYGCTSYVNKDEKGCGFYLPVNDDFHNIKLSEKNMRSLLNGEKVKFTQKRINGSATILYKLEVTEKEDKKYANLVRTD